MNHAKIDRFEGSILGLALGDAFGAPHEGGILERSLWKLIGSRSRKRRWTDDTQMTIDVIESLADCGQVDQDDLAQRFAKSYQWSRGYGPGAAKMLKRIGQGQAWESASYSVFKSGSYGNGGAMRAPAVGLFYVSAGKEKIIEATRATTKVTHAHPLASEGAVLIALATSFSYNDANSSELIENLCECSDSQEFLTKLQKVRDWLEAGVFITPRAVAMELGNGVAAVESCVTSIYLALAFRDKSYDDLLNFSIKLRGDVDTIAAMASAIWGAARGREALPMKRLERLEQYERLVNLSGMLAHSAEDPQVESDEG